MKNNPGMVIVYIAIANILMWSCILVLLLARIVAR